MDRGTLRRGSGACGTSGRRMGGFLLLLCCLHLYLYMACFPAYAASSPIKSIKLKINAKLETGQDLPTIRIDSEKAEDGEVHISTSDSKYEIDSVKWEGSTSKPLSSGDEPRMSVTLTPTYVEDDYFETSYRASNVSINGGSFISARRNGDDLIISLKLAAISGKYDPPPDVYWNEKTLGTVRWTKPDNTSGTYQAVLYRDRSKVYTVSSTTALQYNFYPYMTKAGKYYVEVRTIPGTDEQKKYGKNSDYVQSGELVISTRDVSDGKGQAGSGSQNRAVEGANGKVGWFKENNEWHYGYPNGEVQQGGWMQLDGFWYYFGVEGNMRTGWQEINNRWFYFYTSGQMAVGWLKMGNVWYYMVPIPEMDDEVEGMMYRGGWRAIGDYYYFFRMDGSLYTGWLQQHGNWYYLNEVQNSLEGAMFTGWIIRNGKTYFLDRNGVMLTGWYQIDGYWHYFYPDTGEMAYSTTIDGFYLDQDGVWRQ